MEFVRETIVSVLMFKGVWKFTVCQLNGTAQPSLALEHLRETEKLEELERKNAEEMIARALGSMYLGEWSIGV